MKFVKEYKEHVFYKTLRNLTDKVMVDRKEKVSLLRFFQELRNELKENDLMAESQGVAFNFTLAVFPGIIFLFTLIPFFPIENFDEKVILFLAQNIPEKLYAEIDSTIHSIVDEMIVRQRGGLLSFGFFFALFAATNGVLGLISAFNRIYHSKDKRGFIKIRLIAAMLTCLFVCVLFFSFFIITASRHLVEFIDEYLPVGDAVVYTVDFLDHFLVILVFFKTISIIYYVAPSVHKRFGFFSLGSVVATLLFLVTTNLFSYYINNFSSYNKLYGSIGTLIGVMLWLQITSFVILLGFEINAALDRARRQVKKEKSLL